MNERGFSLIELLVVMVVIAIGAALAIPLLTSHRRLHTVEEHALQISDLLQEARQRALTQRETMRVEFNTVDNAVHLIDENNGLSATNPNGTNNAANHVLVRSIQLPATGVNVGTRPVNINPTNLPATSSPIPALTYRPSSHPSSNGQSCAVLRFTRNGTVFNDGVDAIGTNSTMTGATIYVWKPSNTNPNNSDLARGITVLGPTGAMLKWDFDFGSNQWRRNVGY